MYHRRERVIIRHVRTRGRFWVIYAKLRSLDEDKFEELAWGMVALKEAPRMFQIWTSKQVTDIAGVNYNLVMYKHKQSKKCSSCGTAMETCAHVLSRK